METVRLRFEHFTNAERYLVARVPVIYMLNELLAKGVTIHGDESGIFDVDETDIFDIWTGGSLKYTPAQTEQTWQGFKTHLVEHGGVIVETEQGVLSPCGKYVMQGTVHKLGVQPRPLNSSDIKSHKDERYISPYEE